MCFSEEAFQKLPAERREYKLTCTATRKRERERVREREREREREHRDMEGDTHSGTRLIAWTHCFCPLAARINGRSIAFCYPTGVILDSHIHKMARPETDG